MIQNTSLNWYHMVLASPLNDGLTKEQKETLENFMKAERQKELEEMKNARPSR
jgi:hypothetical protein